LRSGGVWGKAGAADGKAKLRKKKFLDPLNFLLAKRVGETEGSRTSRFGELTGRRVNGEKARKLSRS